MILNELKTNWMLIFFYKILHKVWSLILIWCEVLSVYSTFRRKTFVWIYFHESFFFKILRRFNIGNCVPVDFLRGFVFVNLSFVNVLCFLIFSWFILQLVLCESRNSYPNFLIHQIALFGYKRLNSRLNV